MRRMNLSVEKNRPNVMYNFSGVTANSRLKVGSRQKKNTLKESPMVHIIILTRSVNKIKIIFS